MLIGAIADDFTGASDLANTLARHGLRTTLFVGTPADGASTCEAGVIALKSRSIPKDEAVATSLRALNALEGAGAAQIIFKYCSTFDSTRQGNIGPVADALIEALDAPTAIVCPAFPTNGRTIYRAHLFVGDRLLNESGMENHPITPMNDANIARWLSHQTKFRVGVIGLDTVRKGVKAVRAAFDEAARRNERLVVCDATSDEDLITLGHAAKGHRLVTGGSGIALGLSDNFAGERKVLTDTSAIAPAGLAIAISGSCSNATRGQVERHLAHAPGFQVDVSALLACTLTTADVMRWLGKIGEAALPLVYSSADPVEVKALQSAYGGSRVAHAIEAFFAAIAHECVAKGYRRIITAGGETSSAVVEALGCDALAIGPEIDPGVPVLIAQGEPRLALVLKSGNFGAPDFFEKALKTIEAMKA